MSNVYRNDVIVENFFYYLNKEKISQKQYEEYNNLSRGTLSKWKNKTVNITVEQLELAAEYFKLTINDLLYNETEKEKIEIFNDVKPFFINKVEKFTFFTDSIEYPFATLLITFLSFAMSLCLFYFIEGLIFPAFIIPFIAIVIFKKIPYFYSSKHTYTINHLDSINFEVENVEISKYKYLVISRIISFIIHVMLIIPSIMILVNLFKYIFSNDMNDINDEPDFLYLVFLFVLGIAHLFIMKTESFPKKEIKKFYVKNEDMYIPTFNAFIGSIFLAIGSIFLSVYTGEWYLMLLSLFIAIINTIDFIIIRNKMLEYKAVYHEYGKKGVYLFPWDK